MLRTKFTHYEDDTIYFLYVTQNIRIETDGTSNLEIQRRSSFKAEPLDTNRYLTIEDDEAAMFQEELINPDLEDMIKAVKLFTRLMDELCES
ncbi:hypothetical protein ACI01D_000729 [Cronobacter sakazakii]|uniref:Uncharacterized protein n=1 Tax=Cronobacter sakazakii (strain ATCC BAA-894) TaxID=290339 RepID=A7MG02_CROS8|nr:hypothetical protein [Cronobacter sakazakii]ELQ6171396.1 hypothetical protein [Cronobacter dublinensis]ABU77581.1 hypothetical protein ESA_02332 [Cronobacter sakazakii ATCC BAA-894]EMC4242956.1 hypothetical protein [Cronobacter sakazakii]EMC4360884.1 hypothetical protein [Cronobacter sakazakii]EMD7566542.1 hypothetical protein [Cronobacter sakazakii]